MRALVLALLLAAPAAALAAAPDAGAPGPAAARSLVLLFTGDAGGEVAPCG